VGQGGHSRALLLDRCKLLVRTHSAPAGCHKTGFPLPLSGMPYFLPLIGQYSKTWNGDIKIHFDFTLHLFIYIFIYLLTAAFAKIKYLPSKNLDKFVAQAMIMIVI